MVDTNCEHCGGAGEFDPQLAFARLSKRHEALADVMSRFMVATTVSPASLSNSNARNETADVMSRFMAATTVSPASLSNSNARNETTADLMREFQRIVGGKPTLGFPDCCLVGHRGSNGAIGWFCSGVLIHPQIVLTAGHCFLPSNRANVVALSANDQNQLGQAELVNIRRLAVHPTYTQTRQMSDITVIILRTPAQTVPVSIATTAELAVAMSVTLVGFGNEDVNSTKGFGLKREVEVDVTNIRRSAADDLDADEHQLGFESDLEFVAGGKGFDTCNGDSGGPVYLRANGTVKLAGLTSRATETATHKCGDGGIYTRVDVHLKFIRQIASDAGIGNPP